MGPTGSATVGEDEMAIFCYGDSQAEVFDYVFHSHPSYRLYESDCRVGWRSGWSTRGLGQPEHVARLVEPLSECGPEIKHAFIIMGFGSVDIEWNLSFKRDVLKQQVDTDAFVLEMVDTLSAAVDRVVACGEALRARSGGGPEVHILLSFPFMPMPLSDGYMEEFDRKYGGGNYRVIAHEERCALWSQFCDLAASRLSTAHPSAVRVVDVRPDFVRDGFPAYSCDEEDHHPHLARSQHAVAARVRGLSFPTASGACLSLEPHMWQHAHMYPHVRRRRLLPR